MLSSICFMPTSLIPQSLPPTSPSMAKYLSDNTVVTCMRAGLYQTKNGLPVFLGSLRSRKSITLAEISSFDVGRFANHQPLMVDARLHPADVVAHDEENVRFLLLLRGCGQHHC